MPNTPRASLIAQPANSNAASNSTRIEHTANPANTAKTRGAPGKRRSARRPRPPAPSKQERIDQAAGASLMSPKGRALVRELRNSARSRRHGPPRPVEIACLVSRNNIANADTATRRATLRFSAAAERAAERSGAAAGGHPLARHLLPTAPRKPRPRKNEAAIPTPAATNDADTPLAALDTLVLLPSRLTTRPTPALGTHVWAPTSLTRAQAVQVETALFDVDAEDTPLEAPDPRLEPPLLLRDEEEDEKENAAAHTSDTHAHARPSPPASSLPSGHPPIHIGPAPVMISLVPARPLVRAGAEEFRAHPSRLLPEYWEKYWAEGEVSR